MFINAKIFQNTEEIAADFTEVVCELTRNQTNKQIASQIGNSSE